MSQLLTVNPFSQQKALSYDINWTASCQEAICISAGWFKIWIFKWGSLRHPTPNFEFSSCLEVDIQRFILPGTHIVSDGWRAYNNIVNLNNGVYTHATVNHSENFVDSVDPETHRLSSPSKTFGCVPSESCAVSMEHLKGFSQRISASSYGANGLVILMCFLNSSSPWVASIPFNRILPLNNVSIWFFTCISRPMWK